MKKLAKVAVIAIMTFLFGPWLDDESSTEEAKKIQKVVEKTRTAILTTVVAIISFLLGIYCFGKF